MRKAGKRTKRTETIHESGSSTIQTSSRAKKLKDDPAVTIIEETAGSFIFENDHKIFSGNGDDGHKGYTIAKDTHLMNKAALLGTCND